MGDVFEFTIPFHPFNPQIRHLLNLLGHAVADFDQLSNRLGVVQPEKVRLGDVVDSVEAVNRRRLYAVAEQTGRRADGALDLTEHKRLDNLGGPFHEATSLLPLADAERIVRRADAQDMDVVQGWPQ